MAARQKGALFCSANCREQHYRETTTPRLPFQTPHNRSVVGSASELLACADLLKRGFSVFRAVSGCCSCDIVILKGKTLLRVEVKTAYRNESGRGVCAVNQRQVGQHDILAKVFLVENVIEYTPPLPSLEA